MQVLFGWPLKDAPWYFAGATLVVLIVVLATTGIRDVSRRSFARSVAVGILLAPLGFGVHDVLIVFPAWMALFSSMAWGAILSMLLVGGAASVLFTGFAKAAAPGKWFVGFIAALPVAGMLWLFVPRDPAPYREADASIHRAMKRATVASEPRPDVRREEAEVMIERGVIIVQPPANLDDDQVFVPQDITAPAQVRLRLGWGLLEGEVVSVRNPRTHEWVALAPGDEAARELEVGPGDVLLVRRERAVEPSPAAGPTALIGAERLTVKP